MLVWTDAPGHGLGGSTPAWNNDLDLVVEAGGSTYRGNVFGADGWSATGGAADIKNNAEAVFLRGAARPGHDPASWRPTSTPTASPTSATRPTRTSRWSASTAPMPPDSTSTLRPSRGTSAPRSAAAYRRTSSRTRGFANPVTLSVTGVPAGATAGFDVNPVVPGSRSLLTIEPGTVADGNYTMTLRRRHARPHPDPPALPGPAPGGRRRPRLPSRRPPGRRASRRSPPSSGRRSPGPRATSSRSRPIRPSGTSSTAATRRSTSHKVGEILAEGTQYYWRVRARNVCGFGAVLRDRRASRPSDVPEVLLVDDDWDYWATSRPTTAPRWTPCRCRPTSTRSRYDVWDVYAAMQQQGAGLRDAGALQEGDLVVREGGLLRRPDRLLRARADDSGSIGAAAACSSAAPDYVFARGSA